MTEIVKKDNQLSASVQRSSVSGSSLYDNEVTVRVSRLRVSYIAPRGGYARRGDIEEQVYRQVVSPLVRLLIKTIIESDPTFVIDDTTQEDSRERGA